MTLNESWANIYLEVFIMQVSQVTNDDGIRCANLINFLKKARWDLSGNDVDELVAVKRWVSDMATKMAAELGNKPKPEATPTPMKIKAMGPIGSSKPTKKKK